MNRKQLLLKIVFLYKNQILRVLYDKYIIYFKHHYVINFDRYEWCLHIKNKLIIISGKYNQSDKLLKELKKYKRFL